MVGQLLDVDVDGKLDEVSRADPFMRKRCPHPVLDTAIGLECDGHCFANFECDM